jgi:hypothetical protein
MPARAGGASGAAEQRLAVAGEPSHAARVPTERPATRSTGAIVPLRAKLPITRALNDHQASLEDEIDASMRSAGAAAKAGQQAFLTEWKKQREERKKLLDTA